MKTKARDTNVSDFRKNFRLYADDVCNRHEPLIIRRSKHKNVVLISERDYNALSETNYLLATSANRAALQTSLTQLNYNVDQL